MRKIFFTTILLCLAFGQVWGGTRRIYFDFSAVTMWDDDTELAGGTGYVGVHCWGSGTLSDTDYHMSATGTANLAYADIDDSFTSVCFFRAASDNTWWNQTQNRSDITTNNRFKIKDAKGEYDADKGKYLWADSDAGVRWAPGSTIDGLIDVNNPHNQAFSFSGSTGTYSVTLSAHSTYQFKILEGTTAYGLDNNVFTGPISNYASSSSGYAYRLATAGAGVYTFTWDNSTKKLSISFPSVTHPSADYCYLYDHGWGYEKQFVHVWNSESEIARTTWPGTKVPNTTTINDSTFFICAPGDYANLQFSNGISGEGAHATTDLTASAGYGKYMYHDGSSWGWRTFTFTVTLTTNSGTIADGHDVTEYTFGTGATLPNSDYITRTGYTFGGWYNNAEFEGSAITAISTTDNGDTTLYAKWTAKDYTISYDMNDGEWGSGWVGSRTYGEGDVDISSDVVKTDYNFAGWYDNGSFTGEPVTSVSSTLADNITLYAKWTAFSKSTLTPALNPIICTASEGDVVVVTVSATQSASAYIQLEDKDGVAFGDNLPISGAGTYAIPLTSADAAKVNAGLNVSGSNYTISAVTIKYQKTLWDDGIDGTSTWTADELSQSIFSDLSEGDFLGVTVTNTNGGGYYSYFIQINNSTLFEQALSGVGTFTRALTSDEITSLKTTDKTITIASGNSALSALYTYVATKDYTVTLNTNDGTINDGNVTSYTFGVSETLPTDVTRWGYKFDGWYANSLFEGEPVTTITTSDYGNKEYWAKWTSIEETMLSGSHPEFLAAEEGDILVITVTNTQPRAQIYLQSTDYELCIGSKWIAGTGAGKHVIQLTAAGATALHTGVIITGENYTKSSVALLYKKTIWSEGVEDESGWTYKTISDRTGFAGIADGDYLGFTVTDLYDKDNKDNQYFMQYNNNEFITSAGIDKTGTYFEVVPSEGADKLKTGKEDLTIAAKYLTLSELNRYLTTRDYTVTLNTNGGTINAGNVTSYRYPEGATLPTDVTRTNYTFSGWYDNAELTGSAVTSITTSDLGNKTYYAKWKFVIYRTGDVPVGGGIETFDGGTIDSPIEYRMKVDTLDQWYSLYLPFTVDAIKVIEDGVYYDIQPYYRRTVGGDLYQGHYIIRTPAKTEDFEIANFSDWRDPDDYVFTPSGYTPYVIMWHNEWFQGKYIAIFGHKDSAIPTTMTVGDRPTKDSVVNVYGNDAMVSGSVVDGYTLEADYGNGSWLREEKIGDSRTVLPFECYLRANAKTTPIFKVVRKQDTTTALPMTNDPLSKPHKVLINGQVVILRDNKMYNVLGIEIQ